MVNTDNFIVVSYANLRKFLQEHFEEQELAVPYFSNRAIANALAVAALNLKKVNTMKAEILREILRLLLTSDYSNCHIARLTQVAPNTVRRYRKLLGGNPIQYESLSRYSDDALILLFNQKKKPYRNKRMPDWLYIHKLMQAQHQTLVQLWDEYREIEPETAYGQTQFNYYYHEFTCKLDVSMRQVHYAGEAIYVDYAGKTIPWTDVSTGNTYHAQVFVGVLGCSQYTFAMASKSQKLEDFIDAHNQLLFFFGGVPKVLVPDNLKSAVIKAGKFPELNRTYRDLATHYQCVIEPARVRKPQDKSLAEIGVLLVTRWITVVLRRRKFFSVEEINQTIKELLPIINNRPFKRLPGCRQSRFNELDKPALKPLPTKPFEFGQWIAPQVVNHEYHVYIKKHAYSVPYQYVGEKVEAWLTHKVVEIFHQHQRIASHVRSDAEGCFTTDNTHMPKRHREYAQQSLEHYLKWAHDIGSAAMAIVKAQFDGKPNHAMTGKRACSQLQALLKMYGKSRFENACQCALDIQSPVVKSVRSILQCKLDEKKEEPMTVQTELPLHFNVRGADYYMPGGK